MGLLGLITDGDTPFIGHDERRCRSWRDGVDGRHQQLHRAACRMKEDDDLPDLI
jgi:hypothetical protein